MSKRDDKLCDWSKKDLRDRLDELKQLVSSPRYVCLKCGRATASKERLCKPKPL